MERILSIETATPVCSLALHQDGKLLALREMEEEKSHAKMILILLREILTEHQMTTHDLSAVAVSMGPGSYTGLRIGLSTAKGICFGSELPLIAISTLEGLAQQAAEKLTEANGLLMPMLDARRMEIYTMILNRMGFIQAAPFSVIVNEDFAENMNSQQNIFYFGPGSDKCIELLKKYRQFIHVPAIRASAKFIGELAWIKFRNKQFENLIRFEPFYLKEFQATVPKNKLDDGRKNNDPQPG